MIFGKGTKMYSISKMKCPQCQEGKFLVSHPYDFKHLGDVRTNCDVCDLKYEREPGFFYGAMYVSYAFTVGIMLVGGIVIFNLFNDPDAMGYVIPITTISLILVPFNYRTSRVIFIHLFSGVKYRPNK